MRLFDTGVIIALFSKGDEHHPASKALLSSEKRILVTEAVLFEAVGYLFRKYGSKKATEALDVLLHSEVQIISTSIEHLERAGGVMRKYPLLSLCDALSVAVLADADVREIVSFDADFDLVPGITRIF